MALRSQLQGDPQVLKVVGSLAAGDRETLEAVGTAMRTYFRTALEPQWAQVRSAVDADRARTME